MNQDFIKLHRRGDKKDVFVNQSLIISFAAAQDGGSQIEFSLQHWLIVSESPDDINTLIKKASGQKVAP